MVNGIWICFYEKIWGCLSNSKHMLDILSWQRAWYRLYQTAPGQHLPRYGNVPRGCVFEPRPERLSSQCLAQKGMFIT